MPSPWSTWHSKTIPTSTKSARCAGDCLRLEAERAVLEAELDAAMDGNATAQGPSATQLAVIVSLVDKVEAATNQQAAASLVLSLASKALALVTDVVKN